MLFFYILREVVPPIFTTFVLFCTAIVLSQLLRLSELLLAFGVSAENFLFPFLYILVPFISIILPMAFFFGCVIALSRLNADGELAAIAAAGGSLWVVARPLLALGAVICAIAIQAGCHLESWGRREFIQFVYQKTQHELDNMLKVKVRPEVFVDNFLGMTLFAREISEDRIHYTGVMLAPRQEGLGHYTLFAPRAEIRGTVSQNNLIMELFDGVALAMSRSVQPQNTSVRFARMEIDLLRVFRDRILGNGDPGDDYRGYTATQLRQAVARQQSQGDVSSPTYAKMAYLYYSRLLNPFILIYFVFEAITLCCQNTRMRPSNNYLSATLRLMIAYFAITFFRWAVENLAFPVELGILTPLIGLNLLSLWHFLRHNNRPR